nr:hypothetical protein [Streptomyces sp. NEAU-YJ-81]
MIRRIRVRAGGEKHRDGNPCAVSDHADEPSAATHEQRPRTVTADKVVKSVRYCAVGCAQNVYGTEWERLDLDTPMDMVAERVVRTRREGWQWEGGADERVGRHP